MASKVTQAQFEAAFAKQIATTPAAGETAPHVQALWVLIEPALEDKGRFESEIRGHLTESTADVKTWRTTRFWAMIFAVAIVLLAVFSLVLVLFCPWSPLKLSDITPNVQIALLAGHFAMIFGLTAIILRGAFAAQRRDETALPLPEGAKLATEMIRGMMSR